MVPMMLTFTGRRVNPLKVNPTDVCIEDVAHHLAIINRFNGATRFPISVAQHACFVSYLLDETGYKFQGLHHDDGETYCNDMNKWMKEAPEMHYYCEAEKRAQVASYVAFNINPEDYIGHPHLMHPLVEEADRLMLRFEGEVGFGFEIWSEWLKEMNNLRYTLLSVDEISRIGSWEPWDWQKAEQKFLERHYILEKRALQNLKSRV